MQQRTEAGYKVTITNEQSLFNNFNLTTQTLSDQHKSDNTLSLNSFSKQTCIRSFYSMTELFIRSRQKNKIIIASCHWLYISGLLPECIMQISLSKPKTGQTDLSIADFSCRWRKANSKWWTFGMIMNRHLHRTGQFRQSSSPDFLWPLRRERNALIIGPDPSPGHTQIGAPQRKASMLLRKQTCCLSQQWDQMMAPGPLISFGLVKTHAAGVTLSYIRLITSRWPCSRMHLKVHTQISPVCIQLVLILLTHTHLGENHWLIYILQNWEREARNSTKTLFQNLLRKNLLHIPTQYHGSL